MITHNEAIVGQRVMCNGYQGTISKVHDGQLKGMVDVRLDRGAVCIDLMDAGLHPLLQEEIDPHQLCECGHPLHRHNVIEPNVCLGMPVTLTLSGSCGCKKFRGVR